MVSTIWLEVRSVKDTALVGGDHVLYVDEGVLATVNFEHFKGRLNQVSQVETLALRVVNLVSEVVVADLEEVEHRQDLTVVGYQSLSNGV